MDDSQPTSAQPADPAVSPCGLCGTELEESWAFCGVCGHPTPAATLPAQPATTALTPVTTASAALTLPTEPEPGLVGQPTYTYAPERVKRRRAWAKIVGYALATLVLLGLAGGAGFLQHQTQSALDATQARLDATEQDLADTHASLEEAETSLDDTESELSETRSQLDAAERRLTKKERQLTGVRGTLTNTRHQLDLQAGQIETLKTCLDGVTDAMTYAAYSDYTSAIAALDAVQISCNRAYELF